MYKAIIFDLDGTLVPSRMDGMPSKKVIDAARNLQGKIKLSSASGRSVFTCREIWKTLGITDPCVINGGSQIIDPTTEKILWEQLLPEGTLHEVIKRSKEFTKQFIINGILFNNDTEFEQFPHQANIIVALGVKKADGDTLVKRLEEMPDVVILVLHSWVEGDFWDIHVTHKQATKKHAIEKLIEILDVTKEEVIGMGDGNNDLPLFASVGYKVAMGNGVDALKAAADYVTDSLDNEGFVTFVEKKLPTLQEN